MWSPTHTQVTVQRARGLLTKGKNGTNNCFVTIALGKEKYQTSVKDKAETNVNWNEECELKIPDQGNRAELTLTCLHRNNLGIDEFLGQVTLPLNEMDVYDRPRSKWFKLESKPGKEKKNKDRGELEVRVAFVVKSGSLTDLSKKDKHKSSIGQLASSVGGSLLSIGTIEKRKGIKKFAKSLGSKMHLNTKKKNKDGGDDNSSFSGSFVSIGTPNSSNGGGSGSRRYGQRAGEADPGVISEDEDEFVFDNLSHKSSGSSLNIQRTGLQPPMPNFTPRNPSPLLNSGSKTTTSNGKSNGGKPKMHDAVEDDPIDPEMEQLEQDFSIRARTLPPSKPPRTPHSSIGKGDGLESPAVAIGKSTTGAPIEEVENAASKFDEWESKLYGGKHLEIGNTDSLKRRSWELTPVPLPTSNETAATEELAETKVTSDSSSSSDTDSDEDQQKQDKEEEVKLPTLLPSPQPNVPEVVAETVVPTERSVPQIQPRTTLLSPDVEKTNFNELNAKFAQFEQRHSAKFFDNETDKKWLPNSNSKSPIAVETKPRNKTNFNDEKSEIQHKPHVAVEETEDERRAKEDARLDEELRLNEQRLREEEEALQRELEEEQKRREAKRREEDQRILSFATRSISLEKEKPIIEEDPAPEPNIEHNFLTPEQSPKDNGNNERQEKQRIVKNKRINKRDNEGNSPSPKALERIIIGHEKSATHAERRSELTAALTKKYEGKSREELMVIANGMENEALIQRQRVKELEDYLDNLLLRVMETHPKILQNPYSRTTSAKGYENYINMNDFLQ